MTGVVAFIGPSIAVGAAREVLDALYLPPAAQGDIYRACGLGPWAVLLIDGYFDSVPAVWHREILWAMSEGVHVFGASSIGALRAAELHAFGMVGVGRIFEDYATGRLEDDDEVALVHGPAETGFVAVSEPMVNIRATFDAALHQGVIGPETHEALTRAAKRLHYRERGFARILGMGRAAGADSEEILRLDDWLERGRVDRKREDALEALAVVREAMRTSPHPKQVNYAFQPTDAWQQLEKDAARGTLLEPLP